MSLSFPGASPADIEKIGGEHTSQEILRQPESWKKVREFISSRRNDISAFLDEAVNANTEIILTGAGSSFFVGESIQAYYRETFNCPTRAIATTSLMTHFKKYVFTDRPLLLVSIARSGNSPESVGVVELAEKLCSSVHHLIITCNVDGALAKMKGLKNDLRLVLPPEMNDQGMAVTNSFTCMSLSALLVAEIKSKIKIADQIDLISDFASKMLGKHGGDFKKAAGLKFKRAVFLGSGPTEGIARESHLKLQELTDGRIICKFDSFMGFRHGPKAVVDEDTLIVYLFSNNDYAFQYERDFAMSIANSKSSMYTIGVFDKVRGDIPLDLTIEIGARHPELKQELLGLCHVIPAQVIGFYKSMDLGMKPDSPSVKKSITRVVQGVTIYPYTD